MMRRRALCRLLDVIGVLLLTVAVMSAAGQDPSGRKGPLSEMLKLDDQQMLRFEEILKMEHSQAKLDRENFKTNAVALIEAARRRRSMVDSHIEEMLQSEQKERFESFKQQRIHQREMFMLTEGCLLTPEQREQAREILEKYRPGEKGMRPDGSNGRENGMDRPGGGRMGGQMGGRGGMGSGGRGGDRFRRTMEEMDSKKAKEIKEILDPEQKELYKQVRGIQKAERKQRHQ